MTQLEGGVGGGPAPQDSHWVKNGHCGEWDQRRGEIWDSLGVVPGYRELSQDPGEAERTRGGLQQRLPTFAWYQAPTRAVCARSQLSSRKCAGKLSQAIASLEEVR